MAWSFAFMVLFLIWVSYLKTWGAIATPLIETVSNNYYLCKSFLYLFVMIYNYRFSIPDSLQQLPKN
jgi:hypothetical protein